MKIFTISMRYLILISILFFFGNSFSQNALWKVYDESTEITKQQDHPNTRMRYKLIQSKYLDKNEVFAVFEKEVSAFSEKRYQSLLPLILEKDIPTIQNSIKKGEFTYEELTLFYLKRIYKYELNPETTLNTIIALNPNVLEEARKCDSEKNKNKSEIYGMPILLKDNINTSDINTTAGAFALMQNRPNSDAIIVTQLKQAGALILGKANLSEWAYYFCQGCPVGYSAVGGQTLNPYGRKIFETGGSSSGSGTAVAANYCVAAVGTETAGSIISPSSQNSIVGLKPTVQLLSQAGIVPISKTLDTPGPMTKNVIDNAILLNALVVEDINSRAKNSELYTELKTASLKGKRLGVMKSLLSDSIYAETIQKLKKAGAVIVEFTAEEIDLPNFLTLLNLEMKEGLPLYISEFAGKKVDIENLEDVMAFNKLDSLKRMPYNQVIFDGIMADTTSSENFKKVKMILAENGKKFINEPIKTNNLDAILSINNYHSAYAAVASAPCLTVPMGYKKSGEPVGITFIGESYSENRLLLLAKAFEDLTTIRKIPADFKN